MKAQLEQTININGIDVPVYYYNLLVSLRDLKMYRIGLKPHRNWRITDVKNYFGIKGNTDALIDQLEKQLEQIKK
jgi:hypothetical protein